MYARVCVGPIDAKPKPCSGAGSLVELFTRSTRLALVEVPVEV